MDLDQYLSEIIAGNPEAFARWVAGAEHNLRSSLSSFASKVDTEAILQETLLRVWQVAPKYRKDGRANGLFRLAIRIARNLAIDEIRRKRPDIIDLETLETLGQFQNMHTPDPLLRRTIELCQEKLQGKPALAFHSRINSGGTESDQTLATRLGMRKNTFLQNFTRARRFLAECLEKHGVNLKSELI